MLYQDYISEEFDLSGKRVLVVAPSVGEKRLFKKWGAETVSIDIRPDIKPDIVANICDMPEVPGESFDCVVASYVFCLNYDHNAALREFALSSDRAVGYSATTQSSSASPPARIPIGNRWENGTDRKPSIPTASAPFVRSATAI